MNHCNGKLLLALLAFLIVGCGGSPGGSSSSGGSSGSGTDSGGSSGGSSGNNASTDPMTQLITKSEFALDSNKSLSFQVTLPKGYVGPQAIPARTADLMTNVTTGFAVGGMNCTAGVDYVAITDGRIEIAAGNSSGAISITVCPTPKPTWLPRCRSGSRTGRTARRCPIAAASGAGSRRYGGRCNAGTRDDPGPCLPGSRALSATLIVSIVDQPGLWSEGAGHGIDTRAQW